jgi:hypothetical protein
MPMNSTIVGVDLDPIKKSARNHQFPRWHHNSSMLWAA